MNATIVEVVQNAYGYEIDFLLKNADGTAFDLTQADTITLNVKYANTAGVKFSSVMTKDGTPTDGVATYAVSSSDFSEGGIYNGEITIQSNTPLSLQIFPNIQFRAYRQVVNM